MILLSILKVGTSTFMAKYLRQTISFMWDYALREKLNFLFSIIDNILILGGGLGDAL